MILFLEKVKRGKLKGQYFWRLRGDNGKLIVSLRPETMHNRADLHYNIDLVSRIKEAEIVDRTGDAVEAL